MVENAKMTLPFNINRETLSFLHKILTEVVESKNGISKEALLKNMGASNNAAVVYRAVNFLKYLGLIDVDGGILKPTTAGTKVVYSTPNNKNILLIKTLPPAYLTMTKWLYHEGGSATSSFFTNKAIDEFKEMKLRHKPLLNAINSFLNYARYIQLIDYTGRGINAKATLSSLGKDALHFNASIDATDGEAAISSAQESIAEPTTIHDRAAPQPLGNGSYPIQITTKDRDFRWDIKGASDVKVVDSIIRAIKSDLVKRQIISKEDDDPKDDKEHD